MKKYLLLFPWAAILFIIVYVLSYDLTANASSSTAPADYDYEFNYTNLYANYTLRYELTNLDASTQYVFQIQQLNRFTSAVTHTIKTITIGPGVTTAEFTNAVWPNNINTPFQVIDQFDQILGYHFVARAPNEHWFSNATHANDGEKIAIHLAPYLNPTEEGLQHPKNGPISSIITRNNDITLLHYQLTDATDNVDEYIEFRSMFDGSLLATFSLDELLAYNWPACDVACESTHSEDTNQTHNFVVLTTSGTTPFYINLDRSQAAYSGSYNIPHEMEVDYGAYDYAKLDSNFDLIAIGESSWIVSNTSDNINEWNISLLSWPRVIAGETQRAFLRSATEEVWLAYIEQRLTDTSRPNESDLADGVLFNEYQKEHSISWTVGNDTIDPLKTVTWTISPLNVNWASDTDDYQFLLSIQHFLTATPTLQERAFQWLDNFSLASTFGVLTLGVAGTILLFTFFTNAPAFIYAVIFSGVSFILVMTDLLPVSYDVILGILAVVVIPISLRQRRSE